MDMSDRYFGYVIMMRFVEFLFVYRIEINDLNKSKFHTSEGKIENNKKYWK